MTLIAPGPQLNHQQISRPVLDVPNHLKDFEMLCTIIAFNKNKRISMGHSYKLLHNTSFQEVKNNSILFFIFQLSSNLFMKKIRLSNCHYQEVTVKMLGFAAVFFFNAISKNEFDVHQKLMTNSMAKYSGSQFP